MEGYRNWETALSIDWVKFTKEIEKISLGGTAFCLNCIQNGKSPKNYDPSSKLEFIFIEGFLLMEPQVLPYFEQVVYLSISKQTCYKRRMQTTRVPEDYFWKLLWPGYLKHHRKVLDLLTERKESMVVLNGEREQESILKEVDLFIKGSKISSDISILQDIFANMNSMN